MRGLAIAILMLAACSLPKLAPLAGDGGGGGGGGGSDALGGGSDAKHVDSAMTDGGAAAIVVTGTTVDSAGAVAPGLLVEAYTMASPGTVVAMTTSDANGVYSLTLSSDGSPVNDFLEAADATGKFVPTYWFFPTTLTASASGVTLEMLRTTDEQTFASECGTGGVGGGQLLIGVEVVRAGSPLAGAAVTTSIGGQPCYEASPGVYQRANVTSSLGSALVLKISGSGQATVSASGVGFTATPTTIILEPNAFLTTQIIAQ